MVSQHYSVIGGLTCLQNLLLGGETGWYVSLRAALDRANELARQMGYEFDWNAPADELGPAGMQKLEILKLLWRGAKTMILDEPTAMLSPSDSTALFDNLKTLAGKGANVIVVTHRLPEVFEHCLDVEVLRAGRNVASMLVSDTDPSALAELIVGHSVESTPVQAVIGGDRLVVSGLSVKDKRGNLAVRSAGLTLRKGEVLGLAGVDGNGQRELFQSLIGTQRPVGGLVAFDGVDWAPMKTRHRTAIGLRLIPEDRATEGVVDAWSLELNSSLGLQRLAPFARGRWVDREGRLAAAERITARFDTKHGGLSRPMRSLSGGNQQRFVAARALEVTPGLILAFQPTRGLDIDGSSQVFRAIREACRQGACALVVSFDLDELLENCDSIVVMAKGRIFVPPEDQARDRQAIGRLMVGAA
jgi:simple sugar transport system ATP-binding protein